MTGGIGVHFAAFVARIAPHTVFITEAAVRRIDLLGSVNNHSELAASTLKSTTRT
jgi:hypothetical protein